MTHKLETIEGGTSGFGERRKEAMVVISERGH